MQAQDIHSTIKVGEIVKTIRGQRGVVFSYDGLMVVVIQIHDDNIYQRIGVFHHTKVCLLNEVQKCTTFHRKGCLKVHHPMS